MSDLVDPKSPFFSGYIAAGYPCVPRPIPPTTPTRYLSGYITLNLPSPFTGYTPGATNSPDCFYCFPDQLVPFPLWGEGCAPERNTLSIYGDYGIRDYTEIIDESDLEHSFDVVYGADHFRAVLDAIYMDLYLWDPNISVISHYASNWILADCILDENLCFELFKKIEIMEPFLPEGHGKMVKKWLELEKIFVSNGGY